MATSTPHWWVLSRPLSLSSCCCSARSIVCAKLKLCSGLPPFLIYADSEIPLPWNCCICNYSCRPPRFAVSVQKSAHNTKYYTCNLMSGSEQKIKIKKLLVLQSEHFPSRIWQSGFWLAWPGQLTDSRWIPSQFSRVPDSLCPFGFISHKRKLHFSLTLCWESFYKKKNLVSNDPQSMLSILGKPKLIANKYVKKKIYTKTVSWLNWILKKYWNYV